MKKFSINKETIASLDNTDLIIARGGRSGDCTDAFDCSWECVINNTIPCQPSYDCGSGSHTGSVCYSMECIDTTGGIYCNLTAVPRICASVEFCSVECNQSIFYAC